MTLEDQCLLDADPMNEGTEAMRAVSSREGKFTGVWQWFGMACEGEHLSIAHVVGAHPRACVRQLWRVKLQATTGDAARRAAQMSAYRSAVGNKNARNLPCSLVLGTADYEVVCLDEPDAEGADESQKIQALRWALQPLVSFPMDNASLDVLVECVPGQRQLMAVVASQACIAALVEPAFEEQVKLMAIDVAEAAQRNLSHLAESGSAHQAMLMLSKSQALLTLSVSGKLLLTRQIELGDVNLLATDARMRDRLSLEVQRTLENFERQNGSVIDLKMLVGPAVLGQAVQSHLSAALGFTVQALTPARLLQILDVARNLSIPPSQWGHLELLAIGAACRGTARPA